MLQQPLNAWRGIDASTYKAADKERWNTITKLLVHYTLTARSGAEKFATVAVICFGLTRLCAAKMQEASSDVTEI